MRVCEERVFAPRLAVALYLGTDVVYLLVERKNLFVVSMFGLGKLLGLLEVEFGQLIGKLEVRGTDQRVPPGILLIQGIDCVFIPDGN